MLVIIHERAHIGSCHAFFRDVAVLGSVRLTCLINHRFYHVDLILLAQSQVSGIGLTASCRDPTMLTIQTEQCSVGR